ncbi:MAG: hypothetical protein PGN09_07685 [Sphingomonas fennica]
MGNVTVHAGDFQAGSADVRNGQIYLRPTAQSGVVSFSLGDLAEVSAASEEAVKRIGGTLGWGLVGGALLGPAGLLAGLLAGGRGKRITFVARFKSGRKILATTDAATYRTLLAASF